MVPLNFDPAAERIHNSLEGKERWGRKSHPPAVKGVAGHPTYFVELPP